VGARKWHRRADRGAEQSSVSGDASGYRLDASRCDFVTTNV
jgi:hypothetical protein